MLGLMLGLMLGAAHAADVQLIGVFPGKAAVLSVDGGAPKTVRIGQTWSGVTVQAVEKERATVLLEGKRRELRLGQHTGTAQDDRQSVTLVADGRGQFVTQGTVNGAQVRFLVDTGASIIALPAEDAARLGLDYRKGQPGVASTANGRTQVWRVKLDRVRVGGIELVGVDAMVMEGGLEIALLGMSFLNRVEMRRDGGSMTLTRRY